jgi:hypothetical protein
MIDKKKRIEVTQMQINRLKQSLKEKDSKNIDPRLAKAARIQTEVLIEDLEKELTELSK